MGNCFSSPQAAPQPQAQVNQPAAPQVQDAISQGLGDAQQVLGLIDGIYKYVEPRVLEAQHKRDETKALRTFIGPWWGEALDYGTCMVPVLDIGPFETHLQRTQCRLQPRGKCTASSQWANLLHALAINPGDGILTWKRASGVRWEMPQGTLAMDVRGAAFCHLVNLYKIEDPSDEGFLVEGERQERGRCRLSFGWLTWTSTDAGHMIAQFESDTIPKMNALKVPFGIEDSSEDPSEDPLEDPLTMLGGDTDDWTLYKTALKQGTSAHSLVWPDPNATSLSDRLRCLAQHIRALSRRFSMLILTKTWLDQATRIMARATTNGGKDDTFMKDAFKTLAQHPLRPDLRKYEHDGLQKTLKSFFFFEGDQFTASSSSFDSLGTGPFASDPPVPVVTAYDILRLTLESYKAEPSTSWKGRLYQARDEVVSFAGMDRALAVNPRFVRVLDFAPGDPLWNARVHL